MYLLFCCQTVALFPLLSVVDRPLYLQNLTTKAFSTFDLSHFGVAKLPAANDNKT